jgi:hypothetical protein
MKNWKIPTVELDMDQSETNAAKRELEKKIEKATKLDPASNKCDDCGQERTCIFVGSCQKFTLIIS